MRETSEKGPVGRGVQTRMPPSPTIINIYIEELVREAAEDQQDGIKVGLRIGLQMTRRSW